MTQNFLNHQAISFASLDTIYKFFLQELYNQRNVLVKSHAPCNNDIDFRHNPGTLSVVDYKSNLGKCVEWHQCDVSIETDDQEWAIVQDVKGRTRTVSGKYCGI